MVTTETLNSPSRTLGCFSFSTVLHALLLMVLLTVPVMRIAEPFGNVAGESVEIEVEQATPTAAATGTVPESRELPAQTPVSQPALMPTAKSGNGVLPKKPVVAAATVPHVKAALPTPAPTAKHAAPTTLLPVRAPLKTAAAPAPEHELETAPMVPAPVPVAPVPSPAPLAKTGSTAKEATQAAAVPLVQKGAQGDSAPLAPVSDKPVATPVAAATGQDKPGQGMVGSGSSANTSAPTGVKELSDVRQVPGNVPPAYPVEDRRSRREGEVIVLAYVTPNGLVSQVLLENTSGSDQMNETVMDSVKKYRFQPGQPSWVRVPFRFALKAAEPTTAPSNIQRTN